MSSRLWSAIPINLTIASFTDITWSMPGSVGRPKAWRSAGSLVPLGGCSGNQKGCESHLGWYSKDLIGWQIRKKGFPVLSEAFVGNAGQVSTRSMYKLFEINQPIFYEENNTNPLINTLHFSYYVANLEGFIGIQFWCIFWNLKIGYRWPLWDS